MGVLYTGHSIALIFNSHLWSQEIIIRIGLHVGCIALVSTSLIYGFGLACFSAKDMRLLSAGLIMNLDWYD